MIEAILIGTDAGCITHGQKIVPVAGKKVFEHSVSFLKSIFLHYIACVRGSPMVPLVGVICTNGTNLITNGTIGKEFGANW